jgi:hypothetical protein
MAKRRLKDQSYGHFTSSVFARLVFCEMLHGRLSRSQAPSEPMCAVFRSTLSLLHPTIVDPTNHRQITAVKFIDHDGITPLRPCHDDRIRAPNYLRVNLRKGFHGFRGKLLAQRKSAHLLTYILMVPVLAWDLSCDFAR